MGSSGTEDKAWKAVTRGKACLLVWRIEDFKVEPVPKDQYGSFYKGDSYIVLSSRDVKGRMSVNIHYWLGNDSSQDEQGTAALKTVELDDYLGGGPVQYREVQDNESQQFVSNFKSLRYLDGGVKSGFNHVDRKAKTSLNHVKGKHKVRISEISMGWEHMNDGDSYILDVGEKIFIWNGRTANRTEKLKAAEFARQKRDERGHADCVFVECGDEDSMSDAEKKAFSACLPLEDRHKLKPAESVESDEKIDRSAGASLKLYICQEENETMKVKELKSGNLHKKDLDTNDVFIVDNGHAGIYVWRGNKSSVKERKEGMKYATVFMNKKEYPKKTQITTMQEGCEIAKFKQLFTWPPDKIPGHMPHKKKACTVQAKFDAATLHSDPVMAADTQMVDDGSGTIEIWRIEDMKLAPLDMKFFGKFFGGDCYVIKYTYLVNGREHYIIYYWQGLKSSQDERGASAMLTVKLDDEQLGGAAVQVRVVQGKEPPHFMAMFGGQMIVYKGGKAGWTKGEQDVDGPGDKYLLHVRGTTTLNTKAVQVDCRGSSLNSNDSFVLFTKGAIFIWVGKRCTGDEKEMAKHIASVSPRAPTLVPEGQEKAEFWTAVGGQEEYASEKELNEDTEHPARLFQASNASGRFLCEEISNFNQQDLVTDDVMLLDTGHNMFVWVGNGANKEEKEMAERTAFEYLRTDPKSRNQDIPVTKIKQGFEPPHFTGHFGLWDKDLWSKGKTYEEICREIGDSNSGIEVIKESSLENGEVSFSNVAKHPYEALRNRKSEDELPKGVDPAKKEIYLEEEEFTKYFRMSYHDFIKLSGWKQKEKKIALGLF